MYLFSLAARTNSHFDPCISIIYAGYSRRLVASLQQQLTIRIEQLVINASKPAGGSIPFRKLRDMVPARTEELVRDVSQ